MSSASVRAAALAFALSSWVEGLTQIRSVLLMPYLPRSSPEDNLHNGSVSSNSTWRETILAWLTRRGREIDDGERAATGVVDITTAFIILQILRQPLLPFLLSPLLTTLPLPRSTSGFKPIKWPHLALSTLALTLLHEAKRVSVILAVDCIRKRREAQSRDLLGDVYVRGAQLLPNENELDEDEEVDECIICAGAGADTSLSQSISSLSSMAAQVDALGPLEAFCANAPQKHVAHRSCFLSWHAAYRQQRIHLSPEHVELQHSTPNEAVRKRARIILDAAGFTHLAWLIRFSHELPWIRTYPLPSLPSDSQPLVRPVLTLADDNGAGSSSSINASGPLATLHTSTPPCPGCRSSVLFHFFSRSPVSSRDKMKQHTRKEIMKALLRIWYHHWCKLVTGRTVLYRLASQWSFVMALLSMLRVSGRQVRWTYI